MYVNTNRLTLIDSITVDLCILCIRVQVFGCIAEDT